MGVGLSAVSRQPRALLKVGPSRRVTPRDCHHIIHTIFHREAGNAHLPLDGFTEKAEALAPGKICTHADAEVATAGSHKVTHPAEEIRRKTLGSGMNVVSTARLSVESDSRKGT